MVNTATWKVLKFQNHQESYFHPPLYFLKNNLSKNYHLEGFKSFATAQPLRNSQKFGLEISKSSRNLSLHFFMLLEK